MRRPLSPHLQIYRVQITSGLSALHRISGLVLNGLWVLICAYLALTIVRPEWAQLLHVYSAGWVMKTIVVVYGVAFLYHMLNGLRHVTWDLGWGLELEQVHATGKRVMSATVILGGIWTAWVLWDSPCLRGLL